MGRKGATLGRRQTNTIAFSHESGGTVMGIDASISGEHARIVYDEEGDFLHIMDGTPTKVGLPSLCCGLSSLCSLIPPREASWLHAGKLSSYNTLGMFTNVLIEMNDMFDRPATNTAANLGYAIIVCDLV